MPEFIVVMLVVFAVFAVLGGVFFLKSRSDDRPDSFTCSHCGERDCICHSDNPAG